MAENAYERKEELKMALTKAQVKEILSAAGVTAENMESAVSKIMDGHVTSVNALREERDALKADAEKLSSVQKELDDLKKLGSVSDWQKKFNDEHEAFEGYKKQIAGEKAKSEKVSLYRKLLKENSVNEKQIDAILKVTDIDSLKVKDGKFEDEKAVSESIKTEWAGFITHDEKKGADVETPPANDGGEKKAPSRAAELAKRYQAEMYGEVKKGDS